MMVLVELEDFLFQGRIDAVPGIHDGDLQR
jgi:hypothetical protein